MLPIVLLDVWKVLNRRGVCRLGRPRVVIGEPIAVGEGEAGLEQAMAEVRAWGRLASTPPPPCCRPGIKTIG